MPRGPDPDLDRRQILRFFIESPDPVLSASEVADMADNSRQWADYRLKKLEEDGLLHSKKPGARTRVYWLSRAGRTFYADESTEV